jgi:predicted membrane protein
MENQTDYNKRPDHHHSSGTSKIALGVVLIVLGSLLVIERTGLLPNYIENIVFSWQMLLVAIGFVMTMGSGHKGPGLVVMAVGGFFLIPEIFDIPFRAYRLFWPALFIVAGIVILTNAKWFKSENWHSRQTNSSDKIDIVHIFGGGERIVTSDNFQGGKITAIFGGSEIDFTRAQLAPGVNEIEVTWIFGGGSLIVPGDWNVVIEVTPILGGFSDSRKMSHNKPIDVSKTLVIKGTVIFGGGEIKSY